MESLRSLAASALICLTITGCANLSPKPDSSRFFTLTPLPQSDEARTKNVANPNRPSLGIGPIRFPGYLDREQLVTRISQNRFALSENDRWAEPLEENFSRVLLQNLSALLRTNKMIRYPWQNNQRPGYQVEIELLRFEPNAAQEVELSARWAVIDTGNKQPLSVRESRLVRQVKSRSTEASVAALSEALGDLSREIADAIRAINVQGKP